MPQQSFVSYTALEIKILNQKEIVPNSEYVELFKELKKNLREIPLSRDNYLKVQTLKPLNEENLINGFKGNIFKYTKLTRNFRDIKEEKNTEVDSDTFLPSTLKPKPNFFNFVFYPIQKIIVCEIKFDKYKTSPLIIEDFFKKFIETEKLNEKFNRIEVSLVKESITAEDIIGNNTITELELKITDVPEKIDSCSDFEKKIFNEMYENNSNTYIKILKTNERTSYLKLNQEYKDIIKMAVQYGEVNFKYRSDLKLSEPKSSKDTKPFVRRIAYDDNKMATDFLLNETRKIATELASKK